MVSERKNFAAFLRGTERSIFTAKEDWSAYEKERGASSGVSGLEYARITTVAAAALLCWLRPGWLRPDRLDLSVNVLGPVATCIGGYPIFKKAFLGLLQGHLATEFSLMLAVTIALWVREWPTALTIVLFALITKTIEENSIARGLRAISRFSDSPHLFGDAPVRRALPVRALMEKTADWFLGFFVYVSLAAAFFAYYTNSDPGAAISVLVVAGSCSITTGMFLSILGVMVQASQRGILIKANACVEELAHADVAVLDETLVLPFGIEKSSQRSSDNFSLQVRRAVSLLHKMKFDTILFTGDLQPIGQAMGDMIGVKRVEAELFPEDKRCKIGALRRQARKVVMFGGPQSEVSALVEADVGVVIAQTIGLEGRFADVVCVGDNLLGFVDVLSFARRAKRIITINFLLATFFASVAMGLAMGGLLNLHWAIALCFSLEACLLLIPGSFADQAREDASSS